MRRDEEYNSVVYETVSILCMSINDIYKGTLFIADRDRKPMAEKARITGRLDPA